MIRNRKPKTWMLGLKRMSGLRLMNGLWLMNGLKPMSGLRLMNGLKRMNALSLGLIFGLLLQGSQAAQGQPPTWTLDHCVKYALQHNVDVRLETRTLESYRIEHTQSIGAFLPSVQASIGAQYNFGRAVDPETNTYTNVNTFYNSYNLQVSLPVFDGFSRYNDLKAARARVLMGKQGLRARKDEVAQQVMKDYLDVLYYEGAVRLATEKLRESRQLLKQTQVMCEVGTKSAADVAQVQATLAADEYEVTHQQNLLTHAWMALKQTMNFPIGDSLRLDTLWRSSSDEATDWVCSVEAPRAASSSAEVLYQQTRCFHPQLKQAELEVQAAQYALRSARGGLFPSLSVGAGISTSYYKNLGVAGTTGFRKQFRDNRGEYVFATLSIPLFDRLDRISRIRRQRNEWRQAVDRLDRQQTELQRLIVEALVDYEAVQRECVQLQQKVKADAWAARLTLRKYEEGLASAIEVQTAAVTGLQSRAAWLKSRRSLKVPWNNPILAKDSTYPIQEEWNISNAM